MTMPSKIPATIVTGFLGAGKTTLLRRLLENAEGRRIAVIVNEFGDVGFDGSLLKGCLDPSCADDDLVELNNGCICCTVADDFLPTMEKLVNRESDLDHIVIETSGLALPQPLVRAFSWPGIRNHVTVDAVVTVVDGAALAEGKVVGDESALEAQRIADDALDHEDPIEELFEDQLKCADLVVVAKSDLIPDEVLEPIQTGLGRSIRDGVSVLSAARGDIPMSVLIGLDAKAEDDMASRKSHHDDHDDDHDHDDFDTVVLTPGPFESADEAREWAQTMLGREGILRVKGEVAVSGKSARLALQGVGRRVDSWYVTASGADTPFVVVIGLHKAEWPAAGGTKAA